MRTFPPRSLSILLLMMHCLTGHAQTNAIENAGFDSDFSGWGKYFGRVGEWSSEDADGSGNSGSALLANEGASSGIVPLVLHQCIPVQGGQEYEFGGDLLVPNGEPSGTGAYIFVDSFLNASCSGSSETFLSASETRRGFAPWAP